MRTPILLCRLACHVERDMRRAWEPRCSKYDGLRGDRITDAGLKHIEKLRVLTGLNLAGTDITDRGLAELKPLVRLGTLCMDDTHRSPCQG